MKKDIVISLLADKGSKLHGAREPVISILGTTGSGKSTFCSLIQGNDPRSATDFVASDDVT